MYSLNSKPALVVGRMIGLVSVAVSSTWMLSFRVYSKIARVTMLRTVLSHSVPVSSFETVRMYANSTSSRCACII